MPNKQQIDFGAMHSTPQQSSTNQTTQSSAPQQSTPQPQPTPITSAKAAINAMYAEQAKHPQPPIVMSAREAVNAAAGQAGAQQTKSAANLHHGSIKPGDSMPFGLNRLNKSVRHGKAVAAFSGTACDNCDLLAHIDCLLDFCRRPRCFMILL